MGGFLAELAEVVRGRADPLAEVALPEPVRHGAQRERIALVGDPAGERQAAAARFAVRARTGFVGREACGDDRHARFHAFTRRMRAASGQHVGLARRVVLAHGQHRLALPLGRAHAGKLRAHRQPSRAFIVGPARQHPVHVGRRCQPGGHRTDLLARQDAVVEAHLVHGAREGVRVRAHRADRDRLG